jgi:hypothetical protein
METKINVIFNNDRIVKQEYNYIKGIDEIINNLTVRMFNENSIKLNEIYGIPNSYMKYQDYNLTKLEQENYIKNLLKKNLEKDSSTKISKEEIKPNNSPSNFSKYNSSGNSYTKSYNSDDQFLPEEQPFDDQRFEDFLNDIEYKNGIVDDYLNSIE